MIATWTGSADLQTPVGVFLKLAAGHTPAFLLESVERGAARGRYSVVGFDPDLIWRCTDDGVAITRDGSEARADARPPFDSLRALIGESRVELPPGLPPFAGGLFGYLGYDMVRWVERLPPRAPDVLGIPLATLIRPRLLAIVDHVRDTLTLAAPVFAGSNRADAERRIAAARENLASAPTLDGRGEQAAAGAAISEPESATGRDAFLSAVRRAQAYIAAGDAFQIVPSQRFFAPFDAPPFALYRALRRVNPAPYLFFFDFGPFALAGSSPETMVRLERGTVTVRPLAGTRRRGADAAEDAALAAELLADPKERAEHLMLLDLGRNDVGRVAEPGSVHVVESFAVERFSHVMHLSSTVRGRLRVGADQVDALIAGFPAGTLSGAPKIRAMEIIDELEPSRRGPYGGAVGYFAPNGDMDVCIGLRMALVKDGIMHVQAGAGVVADSDPEAEHEETRAKAHALFRAAEQA